MKARAKKKAKKRAREKLVTIQINLNPEHIGYIREIAGYACVSVDVVCAVMMGCGIFQARRYRPPQTAEPSPPPPVEPVAAAPSVEPVPDAQGAT